MTDPTILTTCVIGASVLLGLWFGPIATLRRDNYRSDIRALRDDLFDYMWQHGHSYDTSAYVQVRQTLNGMLRWSNVVNAAKFIASLYWVAKAGVKEDSVDVLVRNCDPDLCKKIGQIREAAVHRTLHFVFLEGSTGIVVKVLLIVLTLLGQMSKAKKSVTRRSGVIIAEAHALGGRLSAEQRALLHH